jgi:soluble lytic murein transglycosylase-like protein
MAYSLAISLSDYSRRAVYANFSAGAAAMRDVSGLPYADKINQAGRIYGLNPEVIAAVIKAESSFQPRALSIAGAYGLMQVIPGTWRLVNSQTKICSGRHAGECGSDCFYDPDLNIAVGTYYLSQLVQRYSGHAELAVAAYNAGPGTVDKYGGIPPYAETTEYVGRVVGNWYEVSGRWPPGALAAEKWAKTASALGWGIIMTASAVVIVGQQLFRRYKSLRWR